MRSAALSADVLAPLRAALGTRCSGAVVRVERAGRVVFEAALGATRAHGGCPVDVDARFDLASITKPFVATAALVALAAGQVPPLDAALGDVMPEWRAGPRAAITLRRLLAHDAGFRSGAPYRELLARDVERFAVEEEPLAATPGARVIYSDLGFIALGVVVARAAGTSLATAIATSLAPLGIRRTAFRPPAADRPAIPATENDAWRGLVQGTVHDEKAHLMGGVSGHAGLFGDARDVAALVEAYLAPLHGRASALDRGLAHAAVSEQAPDAVLRRGLGWALKTSDDNSCGAAMSRSTFGHTGFTGTSVWADPERDLSVTLLTNAVHVGRRDLRDVRAAVCDAAVAVYG